MTYPKPAPSETNSAIYDLGYRHYDGVRLGRAGAVRAIFGEGLRTLFGVGRGGRAKIPPIALIVFVVLPALVQAAVMGLMPGIPITLFSHEGYFATTVWIFGLFCAFQTPELITSDQQYRVLPLYFSRAIQRSDYLLARFGAMAASLCVVALLPHLILLIGTWFAAAEVWPAIKASLPLIPRIVGVSVAIAILMSSVSLAIAAVIPRRTLATGAILAALILTSLFTAPLVRIWPDSMGQVVLTSPTLVGDGLSRWVFDSTGINEVVDTSARLGPLPEPLTATSVKEDSLAFRQAMRQRRGRRNRLTTVQIANLPGRDYLLALAGYLIISGGVLVLRYRKIES